MTDSLWRVEHGDCRALLRTVPDASIDSIVTDPPYELGFMGKSWDSTGIAYQVDVWRECLRVLKHGGHLLSFGGSRTYHRMACAIEDAGFEIRDQIMWVYGSGFPKSLNVSKSIEALLTTGSANKTAFKNLSGEQIDRGNWGIAKQQFVHGQRDTNYDETAGETRLGKLDPTTDAAKQWQGWGTALKPAHEPIVLARKPLDGTVAQNVIWYGTGALNIDGCRVHRENGDTSHAGHRTATFGDQQTVSGGDGSGGWSQNDAGRFPANLIHDGSDEVLELFPSSTSPATVTRGARKQIFSGLGIQRDVPCYDDSGSAARFFYCAKANKRDRNEGLDGFAPKRDADCISDTGVGDANPRNRSNTAKVNHHPTVKPTDLMRYLCRLITQPKGVVLDPFTGSGSTGKAAVLEGFRFIGFEQSADYVAIAQARIGYAEQHREG